MQKKYQVFISSTYTDLIEERKKVQEILLMADCIPIGMEAFVADNDEQFKVIKRKIDLCDYYVLIIGGRYGSINEETGLSYTEMEYNYAVEQDIPVLVFAIDENVELTPDRQENEANRITQLKAFRDKALKNRMASIWVDSNDLAVKAVSSIASAKENISRPGWVRNGKFDANELLEQINSLRIENENLKQTNILQQEKIEQLSFNEEEELFWEKIITIEYTQQKRIVEEIGRFHRKKVSYENVTRYFSKVWREIYQYVAPVYYREKSSSSLKSVLCDLINEKNIELSESEVLKFKHQMLALKYVELRIDSYAYDKPEKMKITSKGLTALNKILLTK